MNGRTLVRWRVWPGSMLALLLLLLVGCRGSGSFAPGDDPPPVELPGLDGVVHRVFEEHRGKTIVLNFWASWCGPCREELPSLERLYGQVRDKGVVVIGIGVDDDVESLRALAQEHGVSFPLLIDAKGEMKSRYRLSGVPETFVIGSNGKLRLLTDEDGAPVVRIVGPREWDSPRMIRTLVGG